MSEADRTARARCRRWAREEEARERRAHATSCLCSDSKCKVPGSGFQGLSSHREHTVSSGSKNGLLYFGGSGSSCCISAVLRASEELGRDRACGHHPAVLMGGRGRGGRGGGRGGQDTSSAAMHPPPVFVCAPCNKECTGENNFLQHCLSAEHGARAPARSAARLVFCFPFHRRSPPSRSLSRRRRAQEWHARLLRLHAQ